MAVEDLPLDVPWRKLAFGATLAGVTDTSQPQANVSAGAAIEGLAPSVGLFQYVPPAESDELPDNRAYPGSRIVLLRVPASLTGVQVVSTMRFLGVSLTRRDYLPCIGAVLTLTIDSPDLKGKSKSPLYIRDTFPKHQEMILNEILGTETMEREVERHSVTKNWNVSGGFNVKGFNAGGGASTTEVTESQHERGRSDSHVINVSHVHHVLTAYHLGSRRATLTIQPRPYEGENWELLAGPRRVEGIQDFVVVVNAPDDLASLDVEACLTIGFLGYVTGGRLPPKPLDPRQIADAFEATADDVIADLIAKALDDAAEKIESWEKWIERYQRWLQIREFVTRINTRARVVTARLCTKGTIDFKFSARDALGDRALPPRFADMALANFVPSALPSPAVSSSSRSVANFFADRTFEAILQLHTARGSRFAELEYFGLKHWEQLRELPRDHALLDSSVVDLTSVTESDRALLASAGVQTLRDLTTAVVSPDATSAERQALQAIGLRMFAPRRQGRATAD